MCLNAKFARSGHESEGVSVGDWLDAAGDERFALKVKSARIDMESLGPDLALQLAIFECLGYPRNRHAFRHLAKRLPWAFLAGLASFEGRCEASNEERAEALLSWAAGLGERPHWVPVERLLGGLPEWVAAAGRPANRIENRLGAAARVRCEMVACRRPDAAFVRRVGAERILPLVCGMRTA